MNNFFLHVYLSALWVMYSFLLICAHTTTCEKTKWPSAVTRLTALEPCVLFSAHDTKYPNGDLVSLNSIQLNSTLDNLFQCSCTLACTCNFKDVSVYIPVFHYISLCLTVYPCTSLYFPVSHCISLYFTIFPCVSLYIPVLHCISLYFTVLPN